MVGTQNRRTFAPGQSPIGAAFNGNGHGSSGLSDILQELYGALARSTQAPSRDTAPRKKMRKSTEVVPVGQGQYAEGFEPVRNRGNAKRLVYAQYLDADNRPLSKPVRIKRDAIASLSPPTETAMVLIMTQTIARVRRGKLCEILTGKARARGKVILKGARATALQLAERGIASVLSLALGGMDPDTICAVFTGNKGSPMSVIKLDPQDRILQEVSLDAIISQGMGAQKEHPLCPFCGQRHAPW